MAIKNLSKRAQYGARKAGKAIKDAYPEDTGRVYAYSVKDMLTDIRHYCEGRGFDFHALVDGSYQNYLAERHGGEDADL